MISVLLPSRNRPELLARSVQHLYEKASNPAGIEVLIANDPDDDITVEVATQLFSAYATVRLIRTYRRFGYREFHEYFNMLCLSATGDWFVLWNDDAIMESISWDMAMENMPVGVLSLKTNQYPFNVFPAIHRKVWEAMGHFSLSPHCDSWVHDVGSMAGCMYETDIHALHDRADLTGNNFDGIYMETHANYQTMEYYAEPLVSLRATDVENVRKALGL
jgi:glycosyl transferase family 2